MNEWMRTTATAARSRGEYAVHKYGQGVLDQLCKANWQAFNILPDGLPGGALHLKQDQQVSLLAVLEVWGGDSLLMQQTQVLPASSSSTCAQ